MAVAAPERLYFTNSDEANELLASDPLALLIGFALDQQVPVQTAFAAAQDKGAPGNAEITPRPDAGRNRVP
jgi:hypothetical protein